MKPLRWALAALLLCARAHAHEGHEDAAAPPLPVADASRLAIDAPPFELLVAREAGELAIYVDDYASNAPLSGLQVAVRVGAQQLEAEPAGEGRYRIPGDLLDASVARELTIALHGPGLAAEVHGLLPAGGAPPAAASAAPARLRHRGGAIALLAVVAGVLAFIVARAALRRRH